MRRRRTRILVEGRGARDTSLIYLTSRILVVFFLLPPVFQDVITLLRGLRRYMGVWGLLCYYTSPPPTPLNVPM